MGAVESDSVKSARKAKDKLHKAFERASETRELTLHRHEQNRARMPNMRESRDSVRFLINTQLQSHALLHRGFGTSVPFIFHMNSTQRESQLSCTVRETRISHITHTK